MPTTSSSFGVIHTMSQDIEQARRKQQGRLTQPSALGAESYAEEDILGQLKKPTTSIPQSPPTIKPTMPAQPAAPRPFIPAPAVPSRPAQPLKSPVSSIAPPTRSTPATKEATTVSPLKLDQIAPKTAPKLGEPVLGAPKLGELALRPQTTKPAVLETTPSVRPTRPAVEGIITEKAIPVPALPNNFIPVEEEELERMIKKPQPATTPVLKMAEVKLAAPAPPAPVVKPSPATPPAPLKTYGTPIPPPTMPSVMPKLVLTPPAPPLQTAMPPKVSVAAEKPLSPPLSTMPRPTDMPAPPPVATIPPRPQALNAVPPLNLPGIEKEVKPLRPVAPPSITGKEGGLKSPEEILGLPAMPATTPMPEKQTFQPLQMAIPQKPSAAPPLPPSGKFPQAEEPPIYEEAPKRRSNILQFVAILLGILIIGGGIGGFVYWRAYLRAPAPVAPITPETPITPAAAPTPFFSTPQQQVIELQEGNESFLVEQLRALEHTEQPAKTITYLPVKKLSDGSYLQTKDLLTLLNVQLPQTIIDSLDQTPMLYLYTPDDEEKNKCIEANNFDISCYSSRLGIVLKVLPGHETAVQNIMSDQEQNLVQLFTPIILGSPLFDQATGWKTANYTGLTISYPGGVIVRYNNMPISPTGLNYATVNGYLLIATSKNSTYFTLDQLVNASAK